MFKDKFGHVFNWIQKPIKRIYYNIPYESRLGNEFINTYKFLQESQWRNREQHQEYQMMQIQKLLKHAYENVPYYTRIFNERGLRPKDIQNFNDLRQLPYLTKDIIRENLDDLVSVNYGKEQIKYVTTGGSTGVPMGFYVQKKVAGAREWAFMTTQWTRVGYNINKRNRCVVLRGNIPNKGIAEYKGLNLILSSYLLTEQNAKEYINLIEIFQPDFIQAYPSSIIILSDFILQNNIKLNLKQLKSILCGSENIYDFQRKNIEKAFGARVYSWYGHSEQCCLAGECERSNYYHIFSEYGYSEIISNNGQEVKKEGEIGEIVATGFNNYVMPFIRYKTCDMAINTNAKCSCGREYRLIKRIEGRKQEYFFDGKGNKITFTCSDDALWRVKQKIIAYQYVQNEYGKVILRVECRNKLSDEDIAVIKKDFYEFYPTLRIEINIVSHIERTVSGKFKYLVQNITKNSL